MAFQHFHSVPAYDALSYTLMRRISIVYRYSPSNDTQIVTNTQFESLIELHFCCTVDSRHEVPRWRECEAM